MAQRAILVKKALTLVYMIGTEQFGKNVTIYADKALRYQADVVVEKHPEYPNVNAATWTISLVVRDSDGEIWATVEPKGGPLGLKSPSSVVVDWMVRKVVAAGDGPTPVYMHHLGPDGFEVGPAEDASHLVVAPSQGKYKHVLINDPRVFVLVNLIFTVEHTACPVLDTLHESSLLADVKLVCGKQEFPAHRAILAAQSPVFAAMFPKDIVAKPSKICIKDTRPDVLEALLEFAYTKKLTEVDDKLELLWMAGDKYNMEHLKDECERLILASITDANAFSYLYFAEKHGLTKVVVKAAKVIGQRNVT